jgi:hypothetical protein
MPGNKLPKKTFFFVGVSLKLFWFLLLAKLFNWCIYVFDNNAGSRTSFMLLKKLHKLKWVTRVTEHHYAFYHSHSDAIKLANSIIDRGVYSAVIQLTQELCKSAEVNLVFKKALVQHLSLLTSINQYIVGNKQECKATLFVSKKYFKILQEYPRILDLSIVVRYDFFWEKIKLWMGWMVVVLSYFLHLFIQLFYKKHTSKKVFKFAISIPFPWAAKFKGAREFTFLVDDEIIKKDETIFLVEYPENKEFYQHYSDTRYFLKEALGAQKVSNLFRVSTLQFGRDFFKVVRLLFAYKKDFFIYEALICLLFHRISWSIIVAKTPFENYIYFNKEGKSQISTNIFLKQQQITTRAYSQFVGGPYQVFGKSAFDKRNAHWSFLNPDYYYLNNQAMADSMLLHSQDTVQHKVIGNIFSEKIIEIKKDTVYIENIKKQHCIGDSQQVISIFDTSYVESRKLYSTYNEAQYFLKDVIRLAKSLPDCMFLFKPSKSDGYFLQEYWADEKGVEVVDLRYEFGQLLNTIIKSGLFTKSIESPSCRSLSICIVKSL